ncbi:hypothetical protein KI810_03135 [Geobacter luticola]|uniref:Uncharacterized protein n=1 Tax=Geomobilimonas luticola TaxID=1114878 RepID=A0ABS5SBY8_9BACT|nr:hypothetical protein [Geomobilimonas luticola]
MTKRLFAIGLTEPQSAGAPHLFDRSAVVRVRKVLGLKRVSASIPMSWPWWWSCWTALTSWNGDSMGDTGKVVV